MATDPRSGARKRTVHQLDTPYSEVAWPEISLEDQDAILELLCNLLKPLGRHRRAHVKPSKGKKAAKKERKALASNPPLAESQHAPPPPPDLLHHVDIGFNSITRNMGTNPRDGDDDGQEHKGKYSMIFVTRGDQSSAFNCHFPKMVGAASKDVPLNDRIRLVGFSKPCSERLSKCLGLARVSSVAIGREAPGAGALWEVVKRNIKPVDVRWLEGDPDTSYLTTKINSIETTIGPKRPRQK